MESQRHKLCTIFIGVGIQMLCGWALLPAATWSEVQGQFVEKALQSAGSVGVHVVALPSGRVLSSYRSDEPMIPASVLKVVTSYAALKTLGPSHRFKTTVWTVGAPQQGVISSGIWLHSEGDIFWTYKQAVELAQQLRQKGITLVRGGVWVDDSYFSPPFERVCLDEACNDLYNPMVSGTALEFNSVVLRVQPSPIVGKPPRVEWFPPGHYIQIANGAKTGGKRSRSTFSLRQLPNGPRGMMCFQASGRLPVSAQSGLEQRYSVADPSRLVAAAFTAALQEAGVRVESDSTGLMAQAVRPPNAQVVAEYLSAPLAETIYGLNRHSNNFMAEMLLRSLGAASMGTPGSELKGIIVLNNVLKALGAPTSQCDIKTGSGLSRSCRLSPHTLSKVLVSAYSDLLAGPAFMESLAVNGQDGTLRRRLNNSSVLVRGKTGTLRDVVGFAGFVSSGGHTPCAVVILMNDVNNLQKAKEALDTFLEDLAWYAPPQ